MLPVQYLQLDIELSSLNLRCTAYPLYTLKYFFHAKLPVEDVYNWRLFLYVFKTNVSYYERWFVCLFSDQVQRYFSPFVAEEHRSSQLWLETPINTTSVLSGSVMLRWHLPIGLLYDLHGGGKLPWTIIIHFRDFPDKELIACETKQVRWLALHFVLMNHKRINTLYRLTI